MAGPDGDGYRHMIETSAAQRIGTPSDVAHASLRAAPGLPAAVLGGLWGVAAVPSREALTAAARDW
jgi:hypothetical protein